MTIKFHIIEPLDLPPNQESIISFDTQDGKIGRLSANDWILDNDLVSGKHATIQYRKDGYYFIDHSSNGTSLQSSDLPEPEYFHKEERKLKNGDILYLGDYDIEVSIESEAPLPPGPPDDAQEIIGAKISAVRLHIIEPQDLLPDQKSDLAFDTQGGTIGRSTDNDWVLVDDDDERYISAKHATIQYREDGYYIVDHSSNGTAIVQSPDQPEPEDFHNEERKLNDGDILYIDQYAIEVTLEERNPHSISKPKPTGEPPTVSTKTKTPIVKDGGQETKPPPPPPPPVVPQDAIAAFLKGAGLTNISIDQVDPDLMISLGQAFREMMEGIIKLIEARKTFKIGVDIEATRFRAGKNNPFKNNRDPSMVLEIMLLKRPGYIPMLDSVQEAFEDIEAHLIGMGNGLLTSLENTLEQFSPREIERLVEQEHKNKWFNADSQKWKTYVKHYDELDLNDLLSDELAQAYEDQIHRLHLKNQQRGH